MFILSDKQQAIVDLCKTPRTSLELAAALGIQQTSIYQYLRMLQRLEQIERQQKPGSGHNQNCTFVATGKPVAEVFDRKFMRYEPLTVFGVRL